MGSGRASPRKGMQTSGTVATSERVGREDFGREGLPGHLVGEVGACIEPGQGRLCVGEVAFHSVQIEPVQIEPVQIEPVRIEGLVVRHGCPP